MDFKTSAKTPSAAQAFLLQEVQLAAYSVPYREAMGSTEAGLELHHLIKLKKPKVAVTSFRPMEPVRLTRLFRVIESYLEGLSRNDFVPSPGMGCFACDYLRDRRALGSSRARKLERTKVWAADCSGRGWCARAMPNFRSEQRPRA